MEERRGVYRVLVGRSEGKNHLDDLGVNESMIYNIIKKWVGDTDWIDLARDRESLPELVIAIINNKCGEMRTC
jgi:hypothetical protein